MSILDVNIDEMENTPELEAVEPGEYLVKILNARIGEAKTGGDYLMVTLGIEDVPNAKTANHVMMAPAEDDEPRVHQSRLRALKHFKDAFNYVPGPDGFDTDEMKGLTGSAILTIETTEEYGEQNRVARFVTPQ